jgi:phosphoglycolate phosphatase-like HAD superfamily hydrolase
MSTKILLFDFDGTIADTADAFIKIYNTIAQENNYTLISKENFSTLKDMGIIDNMRYMNVPLYKLPSLSHHVRIALKNEIPHLELIDGIREPLTSLKEKGYKLYVVSSNSKENIQAFLEHNQVSVFDEVYSVLNLFGKHVTINKLIRANNWDRNQVMYIGDEVRDIEAAKKSGIRMISVLWGYNSEKLLSENNPDLLLRHPTELSLL